MPEMIMVKPGMAPVSNDAAELLALARATAAGTARPAERLYQNLGHPQVFLELCYAQHLPSGVVARLWNQVPVLPSYYALTWGGRVRLDRDVRVGAVRLDRDAWVDAVLALPGRTERRWSTLARAIGADCATREPWAVEREGCRSPSAILELLVAHKTPLFALGCFLEAAERVPALHIHDDRTPNPLLETLERHHGALAAVWRRLNRDRRGPVPHHLRLEPTASIVEAAKTIDHLDRARLEVLATLVPDWQDTLRELVAAVEAAVPPAKAPRRPRVTQRRLFALSSLCPSPTP